MSDDAGAVLTSRFSPPVTRLLAFGWAAALAFVFLFSYDAFLIPVQFAQIMAVNLPALRIGPQFGGFWLARLADAGCVAAILLTAFGTGALVVGLLTSERSMLTGLVALATGLWCVAVVVLVIGAVSVSRIPWTFALLLCWLGPVPRSFFRQASVERFDCWSKFMVVLVIVAGALCLASACAPPFEYDELEYHLGVPSEYLKAGQIVGLPHNFYSNLPQLTEMLYLLAMVARSDVAAKLLHWSFGLLSALAVFAVAGRFWTRRVAVTAVALFYCVPFVQDLSQTARIDLATTFFATLAFGALLDERFLWLGAMMAGCAVATKWTAVAVVLLPAAAGVLFSRRSLKPVSVFCLLASAFVLPWLIKNWLLTGNPIFPLLERGPLWSDAQAAMFAAKHGPRFDGDGLLDFVRGAWRYSFIEPGGVPVLLMTAPLLLLVRGKEKNLQRVLWLFCGAYIGWYLLTFRPWRFLFPAFPLAAMMGACALEIVGQWARIAAVAVVLTGMSWMGLNAVVDAGDPQRLPAQVSFVQQALGNGSRDEFVAQIGHGMFEPILWMNHNLPATARVLYIGEARTHYARHPVVWATAFDQHPLLRGMDDVTHVYINNSEWERLRLNYDYLLDLDTAAFRHFMEQHARPIHISGRNVVFELTP